MEVSSIIAFFHLLPILLLYDMYPIVPHILCIVYHIMHEPSHVPLSHFLCVLCLSYFVNTNRQLRAWVHPTLRCTGQVPPPSPNLLM